MSFQVGSRVRITGLVEAKQHNSKMGTVCIAIEVGTGRLGVDLDEGGTLKIKACNLIALPPTQASFSGSAFSSSTSTLCTGALPIPRRPPTPSPKISPSEDPPAPACCASWVFAAQAQSFPIQGSALTSLHCKFQLACLAHPATPFPQLWSTASCILTLKSSRNFKTTIIPIQMSSCARTLCATLFRSGLIQQTPPLSSLLQIRLPG